MGEKTKYLIMALFAIIIIALLIKLDDYSTGIRGTYSLQGTYALITDNPNEQLYLSIDENEGVFFHVKHSDKLLQFGILNKSDEIYTLYLNDTELMYGKIIKSYKTIYFVDNDLNVSAYEKLWDVLLIPPHYGTVDK